MAPKAEKKPAPAKKAVAKKSNAGRKKGSKKAVESYKIYIYKVILKQISRITCHCVWRSRISITCELLFNFLTRGCRS